MRTIGLYAREGRIRGMLYGRKVRGFPPGFGDCVVGVAEPVVAWAEELATRVCHELQYTGIAEIEIMVDSISGERFLLEMNPRSWSWVGVAPSAGVDLAWLAYSDFVKGDVPQECLMSCTDGGSVYYVKALTDLQNTLLWYRFTEAKDWVMSPWSWWNYFRGRKAVFAEFAADDPLIAVVAVLKSIRHFLGHAGHMLVGGRMD